jgi:hypothetical protein
LYRYNYAPDAPTNKKGKEKKEERERKRGREKVAT